MSGTRREHRDKAQEILERVGMWDKRTSLAMDLSYGQRKLLEIGRAMALNVNIYLLDEPFAGLFPQMLERVKDILKGMRDEGRTIIFVSHNMDIVREMADHLIVMGRRQAAAGRRGGRRAEPARSHFRLSWFLNAGLENAGKATRHVHDTTKHYNQ